MPPQEKKTETKTGDVVTTTEGGSPDVQAADAANITEGEFRALRDDAGLNQLPGHEANVHAWEKSEQGKQFVKDAKEQTKKDEEAAKETHKDLKDGQTESEQKYREALGK